MADPNAQTAQQKAWESLWGSKGLVTNEHTTGKEHPSVVRERERTQALTAQRQRAMQLRAAVNDHEPDPAFYVEEGASLRRLREQFGLSVAEVAMALAITPQDLQSREASNAPAYCERTLQRYASTLASSIEASAPPVPVAPALFVESEASDDHDDYDYEYDDEDDEERT